MSTQEGVLTAMPDGQTAEERIQKLRDLVSHARSMPMSASCVVNRSEVLAAIDELAAHLPDEIAAAQGVIDRTRTTVAGGEEEAGRILAEAREHAVELARHSEQVKIAEAAAARIIAEAEEDADALRKETEVFIDSRMASFESVLSKTGSQVRIARKRLAERKGDEAERVHITDLPNWTEPPLQEFGGFSAGPVDFPVGHDDVLTRMT